MYEPRNLEMETLPFLLDGKNEAMVFSLHKKC
jgi:hypothetical protein